MKLINFFLVKKAKNVKSKVFFKFFFKTVLLWSRYGTGTGTVTCQKSEP
jgi:hypothetical protein